MWEKNHAAQKFQNSADIPRTPALYGKKKTFD
jgi:hypothetical protein